MAGDTKDLKASTKTRQTSEGCQISPFRRHLEESEKIVRNWPVWEQQILGGKATPRVNPSKDPGNDQ